MNELMQAIATMERARENYSRIRLADVSEDYYKGVNDAFGIVLILLNMQAEDYAKAYEEARDNVHTFE